MQLTDPSFLTQQYATEGPLRARSDLHARYSTNPQGWFNWVWEQMDFGTGARVLELGCGDGGLWRAPAALRPSHPAPVLTDISPGMLAAARAACEWPASWLVTDAQAIPFGDGSFDVVIANHMLYHVPDRSQVLHEVYRVLAPGGRFYASTIGERHMHELHLWLAALSPRAAAAVAASIPAFNLQAGAVELEAVFPRVSSASYNDSLMVTDVQAVIAYAVATWGSSLTDEDCTRLRSVLQDESRASGVLGITKETGLISAFK